MPCSAVCKGTFLNPVTDIAWQGIFPIKIGGVPIGKTDLPEPSDPASAPICACPFPPLIRIGIPISYWEPSRYVETCKDPYCFPSLGFSLSASSVRHAGSVSNHGNRQTPATFAQAHYFIYSPFVMLGMLVDWICVERTDFDVGYLTELDPLWHDDLMALMINPEALLFGNPIAQTSCIADSVSANAGMPLGALYWCMGSWGSAYPLTGHIADGKYIQANAGLGARLIYKLSRQGLIWDDAVNICTQIPTPIWIKSHYRMQIAKPIRGMQIIPIGRSATVWGAGKNPTTGIGDNFVFMIFRKRACCAF